jgi:hypothetical protein
MSDDLGVSDPIMKTWIRRPTAWLPFLVSFAALALVLGYAAVSGVDAHEGERAPARIFQLLMVAEAALIAVFALRWLPKAPKQAAKVVAAQVVAAALPIATLVYLESLG